MPTYLSPGVYVEEVDKGTKPIEAVGTAVAAFIGYTERAREVWTDEQIAVRGDPPDLLGKPQLITNWSQYIAKFGDFVPGAYLPDSVYGYFANGGSICYVVSVKTLGVSDDPALVTPATIVIPSNDEKKGNLLEIAAKEGGPSGNKINVDVRPSVEEGSQVFTLVVNLGGQTETFENVTLSGKGNQVETAVKQQSKLITLKVVAKGDLQPVAGQYTLAGGEIKTKAVTVKEYQGSVAERKGMGGLEPLDGVTMLIAPDLMSNYKADDDNSKKSIQAIQQAMITYCEKVRYCFAILDAPPGLMPEEIRQWRLDVNYDSSRAALYYPWIEVADLTGANGRTRHIPPSGHIAGIYARTDETRGVHKAPANEVIRGVLALEVVITKGEQDVLNPIGVNCIRPFPGRGIRVWGARTLSSDPSWRYINVRRLFNMIEESIERGTQWVVFEPNDQDLWSRVRRDTSAFLKLVWRSGALFGTTPEKAFYVKCDEETNPPEIRDVGQLIVEVGLAPVKPAEFVIFRISQWAESSGE